MKKYIINILIIFNSFFILDLPNIDSNTDKTLSFNRYDLYEKEYRTIYFVNLNTNNFKEYDFKNLIIYSYVINDKTYYAHNIENLIENYTKNMTLEDKIYYKVNGVKIEAMNVACNNKDIIDLEKIIDIY